jgi:hypothetical protein
MEESFFSESSQLISPMKQLAVMKKKLGEMKTERGRPVGAQIEYAVRLLPKQRLWNARGYINGNHPNSWKKHSCYATYVTAHASSRVMPISVLQTAALARIPFSNSDM